MALQEGSSYLVEAEEWTDEARNRALLAAGLLRFVGGGGQLDAVAHVSIGCLQRAELIVGLDRARTQDMRVPILDGVGIPTHAIARPTASLQTWVTRRGNVEITARRMHRPSYGRHATAEQSATRRGNRHARTLMTGKT